MGFPHKENKQLREKIRQLEEQIKLNSKTAPKATYVNIAPAVKASQN